MHEISAYSIKTILNLEREAFPGTRDARLSPRRPPLGFKQNASCCSPPLRGSGGRVPWSARAASCSLLGVGYRRPAPPVAPEQNLRFVYLLRSTGQLGQQGLCVAVRGRVRGCPPPPLRRAGASAPTGASRGAAPGPRKGALPP